MDQVKLHKECNSNRLIEYGFRKRKHKGNINHSLSVPLYMYKGIPVIEAQFIVFQSDKYIGYDIINSSSHCLYSAFYNREYSNPNENNVLREIKKNLNEELQSMKKAMIISKYKEIR